MGEYYTVGLQAGKNVTKKVNEYITSCHKDDWQNFDPDEVKTMEDGSTIYSWYTKWHPIGNETHIDLIKTLNSFLNSKNKDDAYKLICVGEDGGNDLYGNEIGYEIFLDLYEERTIVYPDSSNKNEQTKELPANIIDVFEDFLEEKGINIPNDEHQGDSGEAIIYGSDFDDLMAKITSTLTNFGVQVKDTW